MVFKLSSISGLGFAWIFLLLALTPPAWGKPGMNGGSVQCGQANRSGRRIVGGQETEKNEYPWQIGIYKGYGSHVRCGGSIISKREILTAAHCVINKRGRIPVEELRVKVGDHNRMEADGEIVFEVSSYTAHESYRYTSADYDFAILTLSRDIEFSKEVSPVCLPDSKGLDEHSQTVVSGWGRTSGFGRGSNVLLDITMTTMTNDVCKQKIREYKGFSSWWITDRMLCGEAPGVISCMGDSGGPWVTRDGNNNYVLIGITSWGPPKGNDDCPRGGLDVAARVSDQLGWIKRNMRFAV